MIVAITARNRCTNAEHRHNIYMKAKYHLQLQAKVIEVLERIARDECRIETLQTQHRDSLDFHDVSAASLLCALNAAYEAGKRAAK